MAKGSPALPPGICLCYKAYMRKWMRERMKRRKKPESTPGSESKPVPLQPAYFEAGAAPAEPAEQTEPEPESALRPAEEPEEAGDADGNRAEPVPAAEASGEQPRRRRRRRGGRGRSGTRADQPQPIAEAPAVAEPVVPAAEPIPIPEKPAPHAPAAAPLHAPRPSRGVVVLAIGLPGSGKSSWFKRHQITPLSSDLLRALLFDDAQEQRFQDLIFSNLRSMLKARLIARRPMNYVDATNLTPHERQGWIKLAKDYGYEVQAVFFDVPLEVCLDRNRRRNRSVDEVVMQRMAGKLRPPTFEEGFSKITVVRVKKKEQEAS
jgi:predicted kinase